MPATGGAILASNHLSFSDSIFLPLSLERRITFLAKADYFTGTGVKGSLRRAFFTGAGQVPVDRSSASAAEAALRTGLRILREGKLLGIYPEGTRSPDGRLYRGKTGVARMALEAGAPGDPGGDDRHREAAARPQDHPGDGEVRRAAGLLPLRGHGGRPVRRAVDHRRDHVRADDLSGQEYVDIYGAQVKKSMDKTGASAPEVVATLQPPVDEAGDRAPTSLAG